MKLLFNIFFLLLAAISLNGQTDRALTSMEIETKVWQDTEKDYQRFIKKQVRFRKKLDKHIEAQDTAKLEMLRAAYFSQIKGREEIEKKLSSLNPDIDKATVIEVFEKMNDRFRNLVRGHEFLHPMLLSNKKQYEIAEYLTNKYGAQINPIRKKINRAYRKLLMKQGQAYAKYRPERTKTKLKTPSKKQSSKSGKLEGQAKVLSYAKILIIKTETE